MNVRFNTKRCIQVLGDIQQPSKAILQQLKPRIFPSLRSQLPIAVWEMLWKLATHALSLYITYSADHLIDTLQSFVQP